MCHHGSVYVLHRRVNNALRLNHNLNAIHVHIKEPPGLHHLQALVHKACRIDGYLCSHIPVGIIECLLHMLMKEILFLFPAEGPPGAGKKNLIDPLMRFPVHALKDCAVLRIYREDFHIHRRSSRHDQMSRCHKGFLVGKGNCFLRTNGSQCRLYADHANHRIQKNITVLHHCDLTQAIHAANHTHRQIRHSYP